MKTCNPDLHRGRIKLNMSAHDVFTRYDSKQHKNKHQRHSWAIIAFLRTLVKKISITIIAKLGYPNLFVLKTNKQYSKMTITASEM